MSSDVVMETRRLRFRTWDKDYGELLNTHCNTDEVMKFLGRKESPKEHKKMVKWLIQQQTDYDITFWVFEAKETNEFLGFCGFVLVDDVDSTVLGATELGYRLRSDRQGKPYGYAKEAAIACLHYAFSELKELRVVSRTYVENSASWGLMKRLGMRHDPRLDYTAAGETEPFIVHVADYKGDWKRIKAMHPDNRLKRVG